MFFTMTIGLYTSRVVLSTLGIEDYGIYNVVGGISSMFVFINTSMAVASSRFISFALGKEDSIQQSIVFKQIVLIHYIIGLIIVVLIETIGLWFLYNELVIPKGRMDAAFWVLQATAVTCFLNIISTPYSASIIGHERMSSFAYISILESILKLLIIYLLVVSPFDKLILYAFLYMGVQIIIRIIYTIYCRRNFSETKGKLVIQKKTLKEIFNFASWNLLGNMALMTIDQGTNFLLNMFFGPTINAARGVTLQVSNAISGFSSNIRMAINPQIIKSYSISDFNYMSTLIRSSSVYTYYMLFVLILPIWLVGDKILHIWLVEVPEYSLVFLKLTLVYMLVNSFANPIIIGIHATGRIRKFQIIEGFLMLWTLPISFLGLKMGASPMFVYYSMIITAIVAQIGRLWVVLPIIKIKWSYYLKTVILPVSKVTAIGVLIIILCQRIYAINVVLALSVCCILAVSNIFFIGCNSIEREYIIKTIKNKIKK